MRPEPMWLTSSIVAGTVRTSLAFERLHFVTHFMPDRINEAGVSMCQRLVHDSQRITGQTLSAGGPLMLSVP